MVNKNIRTDEFERTKPEVTPVYELKIKGELKNKKHRIQQPNDWSWQNLEISQPLKISTS